MKKYKTIINICIFIIVSMFTIILVYSIIDKNINNIEFYTFDVKVVGTLAYFMNFLRCLSKVRNIIISTSLVAILIIMYCLTQINK